MHNELPEPVTSPLVEFSTTTYSASPIEALASDDHVRSTAPETLCDDEVLEDYSEPEASEHVGVLATEQTLEPVVSDTSFDGDSTVSEVMDPDITIPPKLSPRERAIMRETRAFLQSFRQGDTPTEHQQELLPEEIQAQRYAKSLQGKRQEAIDAKAEVAEGLAEDEAACAEDGENIWPVSNSPLLDTVNSRNSMESWFRGTLPEDSGNIQEYIEGELADVAEPRLLEAGGTGRRVASQFTPGFFRRTIGANLTDTDTAHLPDVLLKRQDAARNHTVVTGNMLSDDVKAEILAKNDGQKFDVILERLYGGMETMPHEPFYMAKQAADYYDMLSDKGILFAQVMPAHADMMEAWKAEIDAHYPGLEVQISRVENHYVVARIQKREGAPEHLPLFHPRSVIRWQRENRRG